MSVGCWLLIVQPAGFPIRLWPCEVRTPPQSGAETVPVLPARIDPFRFTVFPASGKVPPPFAAVLAVIVELRTLTVGWLRPITWMAPASPVALFPEMVLLITLRTAPVSALIPPPSPIPPTAKLPATVVSITASVEPLPSTSRPPPVEELLPVIVERVTVDAAPALVSMPPPATAFAPPVMVSRSKEAAAGPITSKTPSRPPPSTVLPSGFPAIVSPAGSVASRSPLAATWSPAGPTLSA